MITINNYFIEIEKIGVSRLPDTLRKSHDFVVKSTSNGSTWDTYHTNETIKKVVNLYFEKLNQYLKSNESSPPQESEVAKPRPQSKSQTRPKNVKVKSTTKQKIKSNVKVSKKVEHIKEEVKFIKRFVGLHNKI
ncbi:MAG: hypothetical protein DI539_25000, partial [Flavobacterium psychrophilum]